MSSCDRGWQYVRCYRDAWFRVVRRAPDPFAHTRYTESVWYVCDQHSLDRDIIEKRPLKKAPTASEEVEA